MLSHEGAQVEEIEPYLHGRVLPLEPVVLFGRQASAHPPCKKERSVWFGWREPAGKNSREVGRLFAFRPR